MDSPNLQILYVSLHTDSPMDFALLQEKCKAKIAKCTLPQALQMQKCLQQDFDLILVDALAAASGIEEACVTLRNYFHDPLLVLVSNLTEEQFIRLYSEAVDECIVAPHSPDLLAAKIHSWLRWTTAEIANRGELRGPAVRVVKSGRRGKSPTEHKEPPARE
ncbi:MAG: hypothetical protein IT328_13920 [Caldilineaceae bacterium]|nr:hypothetical protein [Caldilineaceae bacterium]